MSFPVLTCPWDGSEWDADVCLHLQGLSPMIPICVYCFVVCVHAQWDSPEETKKDWRLCSKWLSVTPTCQNEALMY